MGEVELETDKKKLFSTNAWREMTWGIDLL